MGFLGLLKFALLSMDFLGWPVIALVYPLFEEQHRTKETFIDVADKYIKDNGFEAMEKLIATKRICKERDNSQSDTRLIESDEKNDSSISKQPKEPVAARKDNEMLEAPEKSAETKAKQATRPVTTTYAAALTKSIITPPTQTIPDNRQPPTTNPPIMNKVQPVEWTCLLCQVTTTCESNLNDHLRGKKHKSMCDSLKSSKLNAQDTKVTKPSSSTCGKEGSKQKSCKNTEVRPNKVGGATHHWCFLCNVELIGNASLTSHLKGKRHSANVEGKCGKVEGVVS